MSKYQMPKELQEEITALCNSAANTARAIDDPTTAKQLLERATAARN